METEKNADLKKEERSQIVDLGSDMTRSEKGNIYTLTIIGQIEGHQVAPETVKTTKYEHVLPLLAGIEESDDVDGLLLLLNTVGGDIEAGLAIAEMIAGMKKPTVSLVLGGGHSIGIPLAVCTKRSFITPTASMTVHPVRMTGLVVGAPQTFRYFQRIQEQIAEFVTANSRISKKDFEKFMMATGGDGNGRRNHPLWQGGSGLGAHRPAGRSERCPFLPASDDRKAESREKGVSQTGCQLIFLTARFSFPGKQEKNIVFFWICDTINKTMQCALQCSDLGGFQLWLNISSTFPRQKKTGMF